MGGLAIMAGGAVMVFFGGLGSAPVMLVGIGVYIFGAYTTLVIIAHSVFDKTPDATGHAFFIILAIIIGGIFWKKFIW